jgi:hypothetical protein
MEPSAHAWIKELIEAHGLWILFTVVVLECMGIPLPGETALVTARHCMPDRAPLQPNVSPHRCGARSDSRR